MTDIIIKKPRKAWNKGKLVGQKRPLKLEEMWSIRIRLELAEKTRELALFNLAIDSKLRACDLVKLKVGDLSQGGRVQSRVLIIQQKTGRPVQFEITKKARQSLEGWILQAGLKDEEYVFSSRMKASPHITTRQYARIVKRWIMSIGLDPAPYGTHSLRRTKATLIYRQTKNLRAIQLLLGHATLESTVRYLGVEVTDALEMAEHMDI